MSIKKLFVTDLDGTFLDSNHRFDKAALKKLLAQFREKDYLFVAASGRSLLSVEEVFQGFEEEMAFVAENGSLISYQEQLIFQDKPIAPEVYLSLIEKMSQSAYGKKERVLLSGIQGAFILEEADEHFAYNSAAYYPNIQRVADFSDVSEDIIKLVMTFPQDELDAASRWLNEQFDGISSVTTGFESVDIILSDINKAVALSHLCDHFGLTSQDVIAFGDNQNDIEMLEFAGVAVATENARPEVRAVADQVIGHCNSGAVLRYMQEYLN